MLSESLAISQYVHFMGHRSDMFDILSGTDIAVHSAVQPEPFGRVVAEAMLAGVAVVATRAGGVPEFVAHGLTGLLVEPGNVDEMATAIERLIVDKELRQEIARRAAESSPDAFDPRRSAQRITELYDSILRDTSKRKSVGPIAKANERSKGLAP
jgi:glycosyltransferase involved in cell wall biosynthesis